MTVKQLKNAIKKLPDNMEVMMPIEGERIWHVCPDNVVIIGVIVEGRATQALLLQPCRCMPDVPDLVKNLPVN